MDERTQIKLERLVSLLGKMEHRFPASVPLIDNERDEIIAAHSRIPLELVMRLVLTDKEYEALTDYCPIQVQHFFVSFVCDARLSFKVSDEYRAEAIKREELVYVEFTCRHDEQTKRLLPCFVGEFDPRSVARPSVVDYTAAAAVHLEDNFTKYPDVNIVGPVFEKIFKYYGLAFVWSQHQAIDEETRKIVQELANAYTEDFI